MTQKAKKDKVTTLLVIGSLALAGVLTWAVASKAAVAHKCHTHKCWQKVHIRRRQHWLNTHTVAIRTVQSTAYSIGCGGGSTTADGTHVAPGVVAANSLTIGTHIRTESPVFSRHHFYVHDRSAPGATPLDIWVDSCAAARQWGRHSVTYRVMK